MKPSGRLLLAVFFIPAVFFLLCLFLKYATGPYYLGNNNDPAYLYLISSLYILDGLPPGFIQHPGTPLQIFGAAIIRLLAGNVSVGLVVESVYKNPEFFLDAIYYSVLLMNTLSLFFLGRYVLLKSERVSLVFLVQSSALLIVSWNLAGVAQGNIPVVANVNAENFLVSLMNVYGILLLRLYFNRREDPKASYHRLAGVFGFLGAACFVTKSIFLVLALAPFIFLKGRAEKTAFVLMFFGGIGLLTMPIWPSMNSLISWYVFVLTHTGPHGAGDAGILDWGILTENFLRVLRDNAFFCVVVAGILLKAIGVALRGFFSIVCHRKGKGIGAQGCRFIIGDDLALRFVFVICAAFFLTILLIARGQASHYIVPMINLFGILCFFACQAWSIKDNAFLRTGLVLLVLLNIGFSVDAGVKLARINAENIRFSKKVYGEYKDCVVCGYYRSSSPAFALQFGDENQGHLAYVDVLQKIYPNTIFYHYWNRYFYDGRDVINYEDLKERFECILLYGSRLPEKFSQGFIKVREIASSHSEAVYKIERVTITDALKMLSIAKDHESRHEYVKAYVYAREAKALGLVKIDPYMDDLLRKIIQEP